MRQEHVDIKSSCPPSPGTSIEFKWMRRICAWCKVMMTSEKASVRMKSEQTIKQKRDGTMSICREKRHAHWPRSQALGRAQL